ncbi:type II toxin-antitoxin system PemK/MazF family toxin [uncultured Enterovirga sp.]|uniref:type II toxin-antitoxin system PemK/MazF family toxin n=1 Tax=uncultured Enterovirga sp. TaxID=2026352 RepID=UPI0035CA3E20
MKRGEVWTVSGGADYTNKPRPAVIIQEEGFDATDSITVCVFTTEAREASIIRLKIDPTERNGLKQPSRLMVDKVSSVPRTKMGTRLGRLDHGDISRLNEALIVFLGLSRPINTDPTQAG